MHNPPTVEGVFLRLRPVQVDDASYIFRLRSDPRYATHLSPITGTVEDQRRWIQNYKEREAEGLEIYYVIERRDEIPCGLVRLYNIGSDIFTWGSWILDENKTPKAALESSLLSYDVGFNKLGLRKAVFDVRRNNHHALAFYRRFGAVETGADDQDIFFVYERERFLVDRASHLAVVQFAKRAGT